MCPLDKGECILANKFYGAISHIGGVDGDLDAITETVLADADGAFVLDAANNTIDVYTLVASSAADEDDVNFTVIVPDDEAASPGKRWVKVAVRSFDGTNSLDIQSYVDQDVSSGASPTLDAANITGVSADFIDAITEIAAALKSGDDLTLVTGTAGTDTYFAKWNASGDIVDGLPASGEDLTLVSGTAGDANDFPIWNADGDIVGSGLNVAETGVLATAAEWTAQQNFNEAEITSAANATAWDTDTAQCALHTLAEHTTFSAPSNLNAGSTYQLRIVQAAGVYTIAFNAVFDFGESDAPTAPAADGDVLILSFYSDGTNLYGSVHNRSEA